MLSGMAPGPTLRACRPLPAPSSTFAPVWADLEDEDMISPTTVFQGMNTWDSVMALPVHGTDRSLR